MRYFSTFSSGWLLLPLLFWASPAFGAMHDADTIALWQSAVSSKYFHNYECVSIKPAPDRAEFLARLAQSADAQKADLAAGLLAFDFHLRLYMNNSEDKQELESKLTTALRNWGRIAPFYPESEAHLSFVRKGYGGLVSSMVSGMDNARENAAMESKARLLIGFTEVAIATQIEQRCKQTLGDRPASLDARFVIDADPDGSETLFTSPANGLRYPIESHFVRLSYKETQPLTNVIIITRTVPKPVTGRDRQSIAAINAINEAFEPGAERNKWALDYVTANALLRAAPAATCVYIAKIEQGDVIHVTLYDNDFHRSLQEGKVAIYADQGSLAERTVMVAGPSGAVPKDKEAKPAAASFQRNARGSRTFLQLKAPKDGADTFNLEACIPVGKTFETTGQQLELKYDADQPLEAIARGPNAYVVLGPARARGNALVLLPRSLVQGTKSINDSGNAPQQNSRKRRR